MGGEVGGGDGAVLCRGGLSRGLGVTARGFGERMSQGNGPRLLVQMAICQ